jgi:hypothetical protein
MSIEQVQLDTLTEGKTAIVKAGEEPETYLYEFEIVKAGEVPECNFLQTAPDGNVTGPRRVILEGTGQWNDQRQDAAPDEEDEKSPITVDRGILHLGGFVVIRPVNAEPSSNYRYRLNPIKALAVEEYAPFGQRRRRAEV